MTINVTKYRLNPDRIFAGTRGSYGMEKLSFDFGDGWDFDTISVTFHPQRGKPIKVPILPGTEIDIPAEVMEHSGESRFVVSGRAVGEDGTIERQAITLEGYVDVAYTADEKGGNTRKIPADMYDQLIDQASKIFDKAREDVSRSAEEAAESASDAEGFANSAEEDADSAEKSASAAKASATAAENSRKSVEQIAEGIPKTVQNALQQAKDSGEFDGEDGITPHIGENENWYIGDKDTGVKAKGQQGPEGKSGVHVGSDAPPEGTNVWVNPQGDNVLTLFDETGNPIPIPAIQGVGIKDICLEEEHGTYDIYAITLEDDRVYRFMVRHGENNVRIRDFAPDDSWEGYVGDLWFELPSGRMYICTRGMSRDPSVPSEWLYEWKQLEAIQLRNGAPITETYGNAGDVWVDTKGKAIYVCLGGGMYADGVYYEWIKIGSDIEVDPTLTKEGTAADAKAAGVRIGNLENALTYDADKWGESTISKTTVFGVASGDVVWENGYINASSGTVYSKTDTNWWHTPDYMPVRDGDVIRIKGSIISHNSVAMIAVYDANNAYLSEKSVKLAKGDSTYTVSAGDGIAFVRFTLGNGTNYAAQEISITTQAPIETPKENIDHIYERLGNLDNTVKLYANTMPLIGKTVFLAGDSRSSTDYTFYKTLLEEKCGCLALNQGASGKTAAYNASDAYFDRLVKNEHDFSIWLVGGNDNGASGNIGTFDANSVNGKAGEAVVEETDISVDYDGTKFVQAIDHIMRKYKAMFYNFKELGNRRFPRMIFCTDLPQQRSNASSSWSQKANWERKRNAIIECCEKNGIPCLDLYKLCGFDMSFEPYWVEPTDKVNDNGLYFMDGLHPNQYGMDLVTSLEIEEMKRYIMTTDYIKQWRMTTDGLIMYCDGINNTGDGHDPTVTTWTDLSGNGNDIINVASSTATTPAETVQGEWLADGMHVINGSKQYLRTVNTFDLGADRTVEFRLTMNADANMTIGLYYADRLKLRSGGAKFWTRYGTSDSVSTYDISPGKPSRYNVPFTVTMTRHYDADADTTTHRVYVDGIFYAKKSWAGNLRAGETAHVYIGSESTNVTVHTVRIYDRALTDEEIKSNYWYDVERFEKAAAE